jgi:hypothetical protein
MKIVYKVFYIKKWERFVNQPTLLWQALEKEFASEQDALDFISGTKCGEFTILKVYKCEDQ